MQPDKMRVTERKYLDTYKKSIGIEIPKLIKDFDFSEKRGLRHQDLNALIKIELNEIEVFISHP